MYLIVDFVRMYFVEMLLQLHFVEDFKHGNYLL